MSSFGPGKGRQLPSRTGDLLRTLEGVQNVCSQYLKPRKLGCFLKQLCRWRNFSQSVYTNLKKKNGLQGYTATLTIMYSKRNLVEL